ncbi:degenerate transposase, partial [Streptococcus pneumoniae 1488]
IKHYKRLIDKAETCVNDLMAEFNSIITTVTGIGNRLGAVILARFEIFMPLIILLNYKLSLDWILLFISQVRLI